MKTLVRSFAVLLALSLVGFSTVAASAAESSFNANLSPESKFQQLTTSLYCPCGCTRETLQQCMCGTSQQVKGEFRNRLASGATVEQIRNDYIAAYGTQYSAIMPAKGFNVVAYVMPAIIILLLGGVVFLVLKSKMGSPLAKQPVSTEKSRPVSDDLYRQIESEIERYKQQR